MSYEKQEADEMRLDEIQRFLELQATEGKTEIEAWRALAKVMGITIPEFRSKDKGSETPAKR